MKYTQSSSTNCNSVWFTSLCQQQCEKVLHQSVTRNGLWRMEEKLPKIDHLSWFAIHPYNLRKWSFACNSGEWKFVFHFSTTHGYLIRFSLPCVCVWNKSARVFALGRNKWLTWFNSYTSTRTYNSGFSCIFSVVISLGVLVTFQQVKPLNRLWRRWFSNVPNIRIRKKPWRMWNWVRVLYGLAMLSQFPVHTDAKTGNNLVV